MSELADDRAPLALPSRDDWSRLNLRVEQELHAGHQSRVLRAQRDGRSLVIKLTDSRMADAAFADRIEMLRVLAEIDTTVVGPRPVDGSLINRLGDWWAVAYPFVAGRIPNLADRDDVSRMAETLASLHRSMAQVDLPGRPPVAALREMVPGSGVRAIGSLLHGDFSGANVLFDGSTTRVFDFDDCGYGPIDFEIGNTLYMVLFDATLRAELPAYERFRRWFVAAYSRATATSIDPEVLDTSISLRRAALGRWLDDPSRAPIGIRTATPEWRRELRRFVDAGAIR